MLGVGFPVSTVQYLVCLGHSKRGSILRICVFSDFAAQSPKCRLIDTLGGQTPDTPDENRPEECARTKRMVVDGG